jgi:hypothetical protein
MRLALLAPALWSIVATPLQGAAQAPQPVGAEFQVNTYTTGSQNRSFVAMDADGDFVVVWVSSGSFGTDTSDNSVQGQRYTSNGSTQGAQFQINTYTPGSQSPRSVAADADGDFVVAWNSENIVHSVRGQRFASNGSMQGAEFQINTATTGAQKYPSVAADADGDFIVVWPSFFSFGTDTSFQSIQGQRYASNGSTQGGEFQINTYTSNTQNAPSVAMDDDGDIIVVWRSAGSSGTDTSSDSIQGQRYASNGSAQGAQFQVNTYTTSGQLAPAVTAEPGGDFVVVWQSFGSGTDTSSYSIQSQRYASDGSTLGAQLQVNTYTTGAQYRSSVAADADGDFVVVWNSFRYSEGDDSYTSVHAQRFGSDGSMQGAQFQVNTLTSFFQSYPSVATRGDGDFIVVWVSSGSFGTDTSYSSVQGQRYRTPAGMPQVPAMSTATRFALGAVILLGAGYALRRRAARSGPQAAQS